MWIIDEFGQRVWVESRHANKTMRLMNRVFRVDGDDQGGGGGGGGETPEAKIARLESENNKLKESNITILTEKKQLSQIQQQIEKLGGVDKLTELQAFQQKVADDEILKLASEGKHAEAITKATERLQVTFNAEKQTLEQERDTTKSELQKAQETISSLVIDNNVGRDFIEVKGYPTALPDVLYRARQVFKVENNIPVARDEQGNLIQGAKGPLTVKEWAEGLKKTAPHLFPPSNGVDFGAGDDTSEGNFAALLVDAAKKGPDALRKEKARQAEIKAKAKQK